MRYIKIVLFFTVLVVSGCQQPPASDTYGRYLQAIEQSSGDVVLQWTTASPSECLQERKAAIRSAGGKKVLRDVGIVYVCSPQSVSSTLRYKGVIYDAATGKDLVLETKSVLTCRFYFDALDGGHKRFSKKTDCTSKP